MDKRLLLGALLISTAGIFTACSDDNGSNPTLIQPKEFVLNKPAYINETIDLAQTDKLHLSWSQPQYTSDNAPVNITYEIQVSPANSFNVSVAEAEADEDGLLEADYAIVDRTTQFCTYDLATDDLAKAIQQVTGWSENEMPQEFTVHLRVNAYFLEGTKKLNEIASASIGISVNPYYYELKDTSPIIWYLVGNNIGDGNWSDRPGESSFPLFIQSDYVYDKATGAGEITYLNYFTTDGWKLQPSDFNWDYGFMGNGANNAVYRDGGGDNGNIWVDPEGYYLVTINTGANTCTIDRLDITPYDYGQICLSGSFNGWTDTNMIPVNKSGENHVWSYTLTVDEGVVEQVKFKMADSWDSNWGYGSADGEVNTCGKGTNGGCNIGIAEGTWIIMFNDITGEFSIISKN